MYIQLIIEYDKGGVKFLVNFDNYDSLILLRIRVFISDFISKNVLRGRGNPFL